MILTNLNKNLTMNTFQDEITAQSNGEIPQEQSTAKKMEAGAIMDLVTQGIGAGASIITAIQTGRQNNQPATPGAPSYNPYGAPQAAPTFFETNKMYIIGGALLLLAAVAAYFITKK
jgi:hypothetical protein